VSELDPITGPAPATLTPALLAERLASERALREQSLQYERELRKEGRAASRLMLEQLAQAHADVHAAESQARDKAASAVDKRLEGMNEFRDQLRQQATSFLTISVFETWKEEDRRATDEIRALIIELQKTDLGSSARSAGQARGQGMVVAAIVGSITLGAVIIGLLISVAGALVNVLTH
jgi:hypothetical protein